MNAYIGQQPLSDISVSQVYIYQHSLVPKDVSLV